MKIAVCIFGQPRFYKESAESFRKEFFDMPNNEVDVFIHCWDEIGYTPDDDINETNEKPNNQQLKDEIWNSYGGLEGKIKHMVLESPKEKFNKIADSFSEVINQVRDDKLYEGEDWRKSTGRKKIKGVPPKISDCTSIRIGSGKVLRYEMGQYYSIGKCIELKAMHEKENNFKYDLVVKVRTDSFYVPKEIYSGNIEKYYEDKETYYTSLHKYYGGVGLMGHGLKLICGVGNGSAAPKGKPDTGFILNLEYIDFKKSNVVDIKNVPYEDKVEISENIVDTNGNGMFNFPWKLHIKDWILMADSETADRVWGGMLSVYIGYITNDLVRFLAGKQCGYMPGGEVLNGLACLLGDAKVIQVPDYTEDPSSKRSKENASRWAGIWLESNKRRSLKIVNKDLSKRKNNFKPKNGEQDWQVLKGGGVMPCASQEEMIKAMMDFVSSDLDKNNCLCLTYKENKKT